MAAKVFQVTGQKEDPENFLLMYVMGLNIAGVIESSVSVSLLLSLLLADPGAVK